jgi:hypothetical protein
MCALVLVAPYATAATTEFIAGAPFKPGVPRPRAFRGLGWKPGFGSSGNRTNFRPPRMNWVVAADGNENRTLRMRWIPARR